MFPWKTWHTWARSVEEDLPYVTNGCTAGMQGGALGLEQLTVLYKQNDLKQVTHFRLHEE